MFTPLIDALYVAIIKDILGGGSSYLWHLNSFSWDIATPRRKGDCSQSYILLSIHFTAKEAPK